MFLMFPTFPHTQHSKLKPHHYNKYKNIYTNFISISITKKNKYNKTVQCPTTKQYNVPPKKTTKNEQKHKMNKNTTKQKKH